jgi:hypothetical protein
MPVMNPHKTKFDHDETIFAMIIDLFMPRAQLLDETIMPVIVSKRCRYLPRYISYFLFLSSQI